VTDVIHVDSFSPLLRSRALQSDETYRAAVSHAVISVSSVDASDALIPPVTQAKPQSSGEARSAANAEVKSADVGSGAGYVRVALSARTSVPAAKLSVMPVFGIA